MGSSKYSRFSDADGDSQVYMTSKEMQPMSNPESELKKSLEILKNSNTSYLNTQRTTGCSNLKHATF